MKLLVVLLIIGVASATKLKGVKKVRHVYKRQAGGCLYEGRTYQQGQSWTVPCKYNCQCTDASTGHYTCKDVCPTYGDLPQGCQLVKDASGCCSSPKCSFTPSGGGTQGMGSGGQVISGGGTNMGSTGCVDKKQNCKDYGDSVCTDPTYSSWVTENCAKFCGKCGGGSMTMTGGGSTNMGTGGQTSGGGDGVTCMDKLNNCADYARGGTCSDSKYAGWVKTNCAKTCLCSGGTYYTGQMATGTGGTMTGTGGTMTGTGGTMTGTGGTMTGTGGTMTGTGGTMTGTGGTMTGTGTGSQPGGMTGTGGTMTGTGTGSQPGGTMTGTGGTGTGGTMTGTGTGTGTGIYYSCADKMPNCADYGQGTCSDPTYAGWVKDNCAKTCNKCQYLTISVNPGTGGMTGTGTGGTMTGTGTGGTMTGTGTGGTMTGTGTGGTMTGTGTGTGGTMTGTGTHGTMTGTGMRPGYTSGGGFVPILTPDGQTYTGGSYTGGTYYPGGTGTGTGTGMTGTGMTGTGTGTGTGVISGGGTGTGTGMGTGGTGSMTGTGGSMTSSMTCTGDKQGIDCASYGKTVCSDTRYAGWVKDNCCMYCMTSGGTSGGTMTGGTMTGTGTGTQGGISGQSMGCAYKGQVYQQGQTWKDGCTYSCTCQDASSGRYNCRNLCVQWQLPSVCTMNQPAPGMCCKTPNCPSSVKIQYPAGYTPQ